MDGYPYRDVDPIGEPDDEPVIVPKWVEAGSGPGAELPGGDHMAVAQPVLLTEATWLPAPHPWFWECAGCECAFGPLCTHEQAIQGGREHSNEYHSPPR